MAENENKQGSPETNGTNKFMDKVKDGGHGGQKQFPSRSNPLKSRAK